MQKSNHPTLFALALALFLSAPFCAHAQTATGAWFTTISPSAGGTKTAISISNTGNISTGFTWNDSPILEVAIGLSGGFGAPSGAWSMAPTNFTLSPIPIGYVTNITTDVSWNFTKLVFINITFGGQPAQLLNLGWESQLPATAGDTFAYVIDPEPAQFEIDLAFENFNIGTYNAEPSPGLNFNMEVVPEPSTYALLALSAAGLGGYFLRRRRK